LSLAVAEELVGIKAFMVEVEVEVVLELPVHSQHYLTPTIQLPLVLVVPFVHQLQRLRVAIPCLVVLHLLVVVVVDGTQTLEFLLVLVVVVLCMVLLVLEILHQLSLHKETQEQMELELPV
jgi:hypothetical protein